VQEMHAAFDVAGVGNVTRGAGLRPIAKALDEPPDPTVGAPVLDPTCEGVGVKLPRATRPAVWNLSKIAVEVCATFFPDPPLSGGAGLESLSSKLLNPDSEGHVCSNFWGNYCPRLLG
jgi:hypothetical protein